jgi:hypothetical protein
MIEVKFGIFAATFKFLLCFLNVFDLKQLLFT